MAKGRNKRPLRLLTIEQANNVLRKHNYRTSAAAAELGVTPQALNYWLRKNNGQRIIVIQTETPVSQ